MQEWMDDWIYTGKGNLARIIKIVSDGSMIIY